MEPCPANNRRPIRGEERNGSRRLRAKSSRSPREPATPWCARKTRERRRKSISEEEEEETCDMAEGGGLGTAAAAGRRGRVTADAGGRTQDFTVLPTRVEVTLHL